MASYQKASSPTFIVLHTPRMPVGCWLLPLLKFGNAIEGDFLFSLKYFHNWGDKLLQEAVTKQIGPIMVDEADQQTLDMGPVLILIRHYHNS